MDLAFRNRHLEKCANKSGYAQTEFGPIRAKKYLARLTEMRAAVCLADLRNVPQAGYHELTGDRKGEIACNLDHPYRLIIVPAHDPSPKRRTAVWIGTRSQRLPSLKSSTTMAKIIQNQFHPDLVPPPGETLKDSLEALGMKQAEFAKRMGVTEKYVIDLIAGDAPLTAETALKLERVFNVPTRFWTNLELGYRDFLARKGETERLQASIPWSRRFPLKEMAALGWMERAKDELTNTHRLLTFFGFAAEDQWHSEWKRAHAVFRHSAVQKSERPALTAWLRRGQMEAQELDLPEHDARIWDRALAAIRANISQDPGEFQKLMICECAKAGVGLIFLPGLPKTAVSGACVWHNKNPHIYLSLRYKTDDHLWFSFFHEAQHVRQNIRKRLFVDEPRQAVDDPKEVEANKYAAETLIPSDAYADFVGARCFDSGSVVGFAKKLRLTPGVVVGRLQHDEHVPWATSLNNLKVHYVWKTK